MKYKSRIGSNSVRKRYIIAIIFSVAIVAGCLFWYTSSTRNQNDSDPDQATTEENPAVETYPMESEGDTIEVPTNVPEGSIKNYELITENERYKIRKLNNEYVITLYAIINSPDQSEQYRDQLREYKQDALDYLTDSGVNVNSIEIRYEPNEADNL